MTHVPAIAIQTLCGPASVLGGVAVTVPDTHPAPAHETFAHANLRRILAVDKRTGHLPRLMDAIGIYPA